MTELSERAAGDATRAPRAVITLAGPAAGPDARQVRAPDRVLRVWSLLNSTTSELRDRVQLPAAVPAVHQSLRAAQAELERSVSEPLAAELHHLLHFESASSGADEVRIECASLLGWTGGLVVEMLSQLEAAAAAMERSAQSTAPPARSSGPARPSRPAGAAQVNHPDRGAVPVATLSEWRPLDLHRWGVLPEGVRAKLLP